MKLIKALFGRWSNRRAGRGEALDEQAKLRLEREARGTPGAETHSQGPPGGFGV
jgi:hypothetical protein